LLIGACVLATLLVVRQTVSAPTLDSATVGKPVAAAGDVTAHRRLQPLSSYAPLWQRDLRQSLQLQTQAADVVQGEPPLELPKLMGTFLGQDRVFAQLQTVDGRAQLYALDDAVGPFTLTVVENAQVCLRRGLEEYWLDLPEPGEAQSSVATWSGTP
jgi:hypothetical protein